MANCKACHTRMPARSAKCPHCGHAAPKRGFGGSRARKSETRSAPLSPSNAKAPAPSPATRGGGNDLRNEMELPLDEEVVSGSEETRTASSASRVAKIVAGRAAGPKMSEAESAPAAADSTLLSFSAEQICHLAGEHPEWLEPGLTIQDEAKLGELGLVDLQEAGGFDWLARSESGEWVAIFVRAGQPGPGLVSEALQAVGWIRKHLGQGKVEARALVLVESVREDLGYAVAAVGEAVSFGTWRVQLMFEPLEA